MKLTKEEDQVVCKFLKNIIDESGFHIIREENIENGMETMSM